MDDLRKPRILFVDDDQDILAGLRQSLRKERKRWDLVFANDGDEVRAQLDDGPPDVVVTDMQMPGMNGVEVLKLFVERAPQCLRFVLSGEPSSDLSVQAVPYTHQWMSKPCSREVMVGTLERALGMFECLSRPEVKRVALGASALPSPPVIYQRLLQAVEDPNADIEELSGAVETDPALAARVLQLTNSSFFGRRQMATTVRDAMSFLGLRTLADLALAGEVFETWGQGKRERSPEALFEHSQEVVEAARLIAADLEDIDLATCKTGALLHDIGALLIEHSHPELAEQLGEARGTQTWEAIEMKELGCTHADLGGALLQSWGLPMGIVEAVTFHHAPGRCRAEVFDHVGVIHVANGLVSGTPLDEEFLAKVGVLDRVASWAAQLDCDGQEEAA